MTISRRIFVLFFVISGFLGATTNALAQSEKPDENRFTPVVLTEGPTMDEPMAFEVLDDGRVIIIERKGGVKLFNPNGNTVSTIANIAVNTKYTNKEGEQREAEEGLVGLTVHPDFENKPWVYLLYADPEEPKHVFARYDFDGTQLVASSKKEVLEFPVQREVCCHTGGGMVWDEDGNLFMTIGNNTANNLSSHTDERPGMENWDDQRGAASTNDLRGKIIRIHPEDDGSYTIPEGNLFPPGTLGTRPEIYTMGHRNAWRVSIDSETGYIYWGEVGPDASEDTEIGPRGYDELNQARSPGFYGWPYFIGENRAYPFYDYVADTTRAPKDPAKPINNSVNNTGLTELPPAQPAFIAYPYGVSEKYPLVGSGGRSATGGPIYRRADFDNPERPFPAYYEGKWLAADLARGWIMAITMDENSDYVSMERFVPSYNPAEIIDIKFGPEGDLYVLEYGSRWFRDSEDDKLVRIEYNAGNRPPLVTASADKSGGQLPLTVNLSAAGTMDYDGDALTYSWSVKDVAGNEVNNYLKQTKGESVALQIDKAGVYTVSVAATDPAGASASKTLTITAGNEPPKVDLQLASNQSFFFPDKPIDYSVEVMDAEDGSLDNGIAADQVAMSIDYISEGFDFAEVMQGQRSVDASTQFAVAQALMDQSDCSVCHQRDVRSAGPSFIEIAEKYKNQPGVEEVLAEKVINGGTGVWGEISMPAHPTISQNNARTMVNYILNIENDTRSTLPLAGKSMLEIPEGDNGNGTVVLRAAYQDRGADGVPALASEEVILLKSANVQPGTADVLEGVEAAQNRGSGPITVNAFDGGHIAFKGVDMTGIERLDLIAVASGRSGNVGGAIEVRKGSMDGALLGLAEIELAQGRSWRRNVEPKQIAVDESGPIDLYFIFKNAQAREIDPLFSFSRITFVPAE